MQPGFLLGRVLFSVIFQVALNGIEVCSKLPEMYIVIPCIRLARGKFELSNQDSAGGKKSSVLTSSRQVR